MGVSGVAALPVPSLLPPKRERGWEEGEEAAVEAASPLLLGENKDGDEGGSAITRDDVEALETDECSRWRCCRTTMGVVGVGGIAMGEVVVVRSLSLRLRLDSVVMELGQPDAWRTTVGVESNGGKGTGESKDGGKDSGNTER